MKRRKHSTRRRKTSHRASRYNKSRATRRTKRTRRSRRNRGLTGYQKFVKSHGGLIKKHGVKGMRMIGKLWRSKKSH